MRLIYKDNDKLSILSLIGIVVKVVFSVKGHRARVDVLIARDEEPETAHEIRQSGCNDNKSNNFVHVFGSVEVIHFLLPIRVF